MSRPSACRAGPTCALPWQRFSHASILAGLQFGICWSTTSQTSVWAQAGDTGTHSRFLPRNLIHRCLLKDAKLPSQTQHFVLLQRKKNSVWVQGQSITATRLSRRLSSLPHPNTLSCGGCSVSQVPVGSGCPSTLHLCPTSLLLSLWPCEGAGFYPVGFP